MKILDRYIIKSFMMTFISVFVILFFIFVLQGIWLFISDLAGKDLDVFTILKFLSFYAPTIVPLALPLSVVLASIMTFGTFAENYEFAAMKSSGISLQRAMKMLTVCILILGLVTFVFANNVIPEAQYRFMNMRKTILQQKPALAIAKGQFNTIGATSIKVDDKSGERGEILHGVVMHIKNVSAGLGANTVIKAESGILHSDDSGNRLQLELYNGNYYENILPDNYAERKRLPFTKSSFKRYVINIDLSKLNENQDNSEITSEKMLNISELNYTLDSLHTDYKNAIVSFADNIARRNDYIFKISDSIQKKPTQKTENLLELYTNSEKRQILEIAKNNVSSTEFTILNNQSDLQSRKKNINLHWIVWHEKIMIAYSCLLMFFIGAPLGAIIRKGGIGLPMVFAVGVFILFHFVNTFGRKLAQEGGISVFLGVWMSSILLTPLAVVLTYRAANDMNFTIDFDWLIKPFKHLFLKKKQVNQE